MDGHCDYLASRLGIPDASSLIVPSPFDYRSSVLLYLADDAGANHPDYRDALERTLIDAIDATRGRACAVHLARACWRDMARSITEPHCRIGALRVLAQRRDGSPQQLTERLRRETNVAVLGTASFWEGVDVAVRR